MAQDAPCRVQAELLAQGGRGGVPQLVGVPGRDVGLPAAIADRMMVRFDAVAIAQRTYKAYRELLASAHVQRAANAGARAQRLLWASTGTKDPSASDTLYVKALAAPFTVNTMPESTLKAFADHGEVGDMLAPDGGDCGQAGWPRLVAGADTAPGAPPKDAWECWLRSWLYSMEEKAGEAACPWPARCSTCARGLRFRS